MDEEDTLEHREGKETVERVRDFETTSFLMAKRKLKKNNFFEDIKLDGMQQDYVENASLKNWDSLKQLDLKKELKQVNV